ncbi:MAG TPA: hypothetical protein VFY89_05850 [Ktedonobacterales bacterium]
MAQLSMTDIERIFRRQGWRYDLTDEDSLATDFNGVVMLLEVAENGQALVITAGVFITNDANRQTALAHGRDVDTFLAAVDYAITDARYYRSRESGSVFYSSRVPVPASGKLDDITLARALANAVDAANTFSPMIENMIHGRLTLQHALDILERAVQAAENLRRSA